MGWEDGRTQALYPHKHPANPTPPSGEPPPLAMGTGLGKSVVNQWDRARPMARGDRVDDGAKSLADSGAPVMRADVLG